MREAIPESMRENKFFKTVAEHFPDGEWEFIQNQNEETPPLPKRFQFTAKEQEHFDWFCRKYGDDIESTNEEGKTLLHVEVESWGDVESVKLLVSNGANVNARDQNGNTPLHLALHCLHRIIYEFSEDMDYEIETQQMIQEQIGVIRCLVSAWANIHVKDNTGYTPLERAKAIGNTEVLECFCGKR